jgi:hypothetical protein
VRPKPKELSDTAIQAAKPADNPRKIADSRRLFLLVQPSGSKLGRLKYRIAGKEQLLSLGIYPDVGLEAARDRREAIRAQIAAGIDPSAVRKATKASRAGSHNRVEPIAREWFGRNPSTWASAPAHKIIRRCEVDVFPEIGAPPMNEITAPVLLSVVRRIESRGALETAHRALQSCGQVFRYAVATGRAERDPTGDLRGALTPMTKGRFAAVTERGKVGDLLRTLGGTTARCPCAAPCGWLPWCSRARVSCVRPHGRVSTWTRPHGAI